MSDKNGLPKDWKMLMLGEVCMKITDGSHFSPKSTSEGYPYVTVRDLVNDKIDFENCKWISEKSYNDLAKTGCRPFLNDLLFSKDGTVGKVSIIDFEKEFVVLSSLAILRPDLDKIIPRYLFHILKSNLFLQQALGKKKGVAIRRLILRDLKELTLNVPPLPVQHRIVEKIEELFSEVDAGVANLRQAKAQLKTYRQAVLKWAFEGRLNHDANDYSDDRDLPQGWKWKTIKEITTLLGDGLHGTPQYTEDGEYYFINGNNLSDGKIVFKENTKRVSHEEYEKYKKKLNERSILVSINGTLGYTAFYRNEKVILGKSACYFNVSDGIDKEYVRYCITSQRFINYASKNATGSTIKNVSLKSMREFPIPVPPNIEEQHLIVQEIESRQSVADKLEEAIDHSLQQADALKQSILKQAFEGKLITNHKIEKHVHLQG